MFLIFMWLTVAIFSWLLTWGIRRYALKTSLLDIPNKRSSHTIPTPRGAGLAIVISFLMVLLVLNQMAIIDLSLTIALFVSGLWVAALGFMDDINNLSARVRLSGHFLAAVFALYWLGGMPAITLFGHILPAGMLVNFVAIFYMVWLLNLYNFMDGIDGLAGSESLFLCFASALIYWLTGNHALVFLPLGLGAAVAGFLYWNLPPARIFMGDVGSGFLGIIFAILSIQAAAVSIHLFWSWLILLGFFIVDTTVTLLRRAAQGEKFYEAHRTHAYQHAAQFFHSHLHVVFAVLLINFFWLLPLAILAGIGYVDGFFALLIAYIPLILLVIKFHAGKSSTFSFVKAATKKSL